VPPDLLPLFRGLDNRTPSPALPDGWARIAENVFAINGDEASPSRLRDGFTRVADGYPNLCFGLFSWYDSDDQIQYLFSYGPDWTQGEDLDDRRCSYHYGGGQLLLAALGAWPAGARECGPNMFVKWRNQIFACDGFYNYRIDLDEYAGAGGLTCIFPLGADMPTAAPVLAEGAAGTLDGTYSYVYQYVNTTLGQRSDPSDAGTITVASKKVNLTLVESPDDSYDSIDLFRTRSDGARYLKVGRYASTTTITGENAADSALGVEVGLAGDNVSGRLPPVRVLHQLSDGRLMGGNDSFNGLPRHIYISYDADHPTEFPTANTIQVGDRTSGELVSACSFGDDTLLVFTDSLFILRTHDSDVEKRGPGIGGCGRWCCCETPYGAIVVNQLGVYLFTGYRLEKISDCIQGTWDTVDTSHLKYVTCDYLAAVDHVVIGVCTSEGAMRNDTLLWLDCRTVSRTARYRKQAPRWSTSPYCRPDAAVVVDPHEGTELVYLIAVRRGILGKLELGRKSDLVAGGSATYPTRYTFAGAFTAPVASGSSGSIIGANLAVTSGAAKGQVREIIGITGNTLALSTGISGVENGDTYQIGAIPFKLRTREISFGQHAREKLWHELHVVMEQGTP
jgi:hypothetical protein